MTTALSDIDVSRDTLERTSQVLVLAPRFPSINQPWIDTYLEQLQNENLQFAVFTTLRTPQVYQEKVDRLRLRSRSVRIETATWPIMRRFLRIACRSPRQTLRFCIGMLNSVGAGLDSRSRLRLLIRGFTVTETAKKFSDARIVHAHSLEMAFDFLPACQALKLPLVLTFHGLTPSGVPQLSPARRSRIFEYATLVLVNTQFAKAHAADLGCPQSKLLTIPQGLPLDDFPYRCAPDGELSGRVSILTVGRFHRDKGHVYALLALKRLMDSGIDIEWHFVGTGPDKARLIRWRRFLDVEGNSKIHEAIASKDLLKLYQQADIFVLPSLDLSHRNEHVETQGVVLQEAQATGCIPIASRVGGIPECIRDGVDGLLIRPRSHRAIADAISQLIERRREWPEMRRRGRSNVEQRFSSRVIGRQMAGILRQVSENQET